MKKIINVFQPQLGNDELKSIKRVFKSNWLGKGKITDEFEMEFSSYLSVKNELIKSTTCCTEGLFQSMRLLNIGQGDEVILPTISFIGAINAIVDSGATPIFCDVDAHTLNATAETISEKVTSKTKAVIIIHYGGYPCSMDDIIDLTDKYDIYLIEDSACSIASKYKGQNCGTFGDIGVWSFDAMKILVTGDGGMIYIKNPELSVQIEKCFTLVLKVKVD